MDKQSVIIISKNPFSCKKSKSFISPYKQLNLNLDTSMRLKTFRLNTKKKFIELIWKKGKKYSSHKKNKGYYGNRTPTNQRSNNFWEIE